MADDDRWRIDAELLVPGRGEPVRDGTVLVEGGRITYAGPRTSAPRSGLAATTVRTVMPGLWDCHAHFLGLRELDLANLLREPQVVLAARAVRAARDVLHAGFTTVREPGGLGIHLARAIDEGTIDGPTIHAAGAVISPTGGHADVHSYPLPTVLDHGAHDGITQLCDGVPECLRGVRLQLRRNARFIKVCASGGVLSEVDHPIHQQFSDEELRVMVEEAGRAERIVAAHCHGKPGIMAALAAGVRTIEHGTYLDDEAARAMKESDAILVSTRAVVARMTGALEGLPPYAADKVRRLADQHLEAMQVAREAGVRIAAGTDFATVGAASLTPLGHNGEELGHLVEAGYTPLQAIEAATASAPATLGPQAPRSGQLLSGYDADIIGVDGDPTRDIAILADPGRITHVWKRGRQFKAPAA